MVAPGSLIVDVQRAIDDREPGATTATIARVDPSGCRRKFLWNRNECVAELPNAEIYLYNT
jgi:hypothetical protein